MIKLSKAFKKLDGINGVLAAGLIITMIRLIYLSVGDLNLYPDEAQYWVWSKTFSFGYYSKPPMIAWIIGQGTALCGNTEFCIRYPSPLIHLATSLIVYLIAKEVSTKKIAVLSSLTYLTLPAITLSSYLMTTDVPLLLFWALSLYFFVLATKYKKLKWWLLAGISAGFGMLSKYSMVVFLVSAISYLYFSDRKKLFSKNFIAALLVAILVFLPNIFWNIVNGFVSFSHTGDNLSGGGNLINPHKFFEFMGNQFAVFGPVLFFVLLVLLLLKPSNFIKKQNILFHFTAPFLLIVMAVSFITRAHGNWAAPAYVAATILVIQWLVEKKKDYLVYTSLAIHILAAIIMYNFYFFTDLAGIKLPKDPFDRLRGWKEMAIEINKVRKENPDRVIFTDDRETLAALKYYLRSKDGEPAKILKWNKDGRTDDHFDLTSDLKAEKGKDTIFIDNYSDEKKLYPYFSSVHKEKNVIIKLKARKRTIGIYFADGFKGY